MLQMHLVIGMLGSGALVVRQEVAGPLAGPLASCQRAIISILAAILLLCLPLKMLLEFLLEVIVAIGVVLFWLGSGLVGLPGAKTAVCSFLRLSFLCLQLIQPIL